MTRHTCFAVFGWRSINLLVNEVGIKSVRRSTLYADAAKASGSISNKQIFHRWITAFTIAL